MFGLMWEGKPENIPSCSKLVNQWIEQIVNGPTRDHDTDYNMFSQCTSFGFIDINHLPLLDLIPALDKMLSDVQHYGTFKSHMDLFNVRKEPRKETQRLHHAMASLQHPESTGH